MLALQVWTLFYTRSTQDLDSVGRGGSRHRTATTHMVRLNCLNACREVEDDINAGVRRTRMEWGCPTVTGSQVCDEAFDGDRPRNGGSCIEVWFGWTEEIGTPTWAARDLQGTTVWGLGARSVGGEAGDEPMIRGCLDWQGPEGPEYSRRVTE